MPGMFQATVEQEAVCHWSLKPLWKIETNWRVYFRCIFKKQKKKTESSYPVQRPLRFLKNCDTGSDFPAGQITILSVH